MTDFHHKLHQLRLRRYRLDGAPPLRTADEALDFLEEVGFCLLFSHQGIELPNLWDISEGRPWLWKDMLTIQKRLYYGKRFQGRVGFISLALLPALYALTPTAEFAGDRFELYRHGHLSAAASQLVSVVLAKGPIPTRDFRRALGMAGSQHRYRFTKALAEAEAQFLIVKVDTTTTDYARYTYVWDSFGRFWPEIVKADPPLTHQEAGMILIKRYVQTVSATTTTQIARLFALNESFVRYIADLLIEAGELVRRRVDGVTYLINPDDIKALF